VALPSARTPLSLQSRVNQRQARRPAESRLCQSAESLSGFPSRGATGVCHAASVHPPGGSSPSRQQQLRCPHVPSAFGEALVVRIRPPTAGASLRGRGSMTVACRRAAGRCHQGDVPVRRRGWHAGEVSVAVLDDIAHGRTVSICGVCSYPAPGRRGAANAGPVYGRRAPLSTR
jgi:hypothetical protein